MPVNVIKTKRDEEKWDRASQIAKEAGKENNYAYIMGVYKKMNPDYEFKKVSSVIVRASKQGNGYRNFEKIGKEKADPLLMLPGIAAIGGGITGYKNPDLFDPKSLFPGVKSKTKKAKILSAILGSGTAATVGWLPAALRDTYREGKKLYPKKSMQKKAAIGQKSTATQDFLGGFDPTGSYTGAYGLANQARGKTESEHAKSKALAVGGGVVGSGLALPAATTGLIEGVQAGMKAKGGIGARLAAGAKGFAKGTMTIPKTIVGALKVRNIGNRAVREGGTKLSKGERSTLMNLAGEMPLKNLFGKKEKGDPGMFDSLNLIARNKVSKKMGEKLKNEASAGLKAGIGGMALGGAVGGIGAGIQYDKGRKSYDDTVAFARRKNEI